MMKRREKKEKLITQSTKSSAKHSSAHVMDQVCMTASGTGTVAFINNFTADRSNRMNENRYSHELRCNQNRGMVYPPPEHDKISKLANFVFKDSPAQ